MATKRQLIDRWTTGPGLEVGKRVLAFLELLKSAWPGEHGGKSEELFALLEGLPFREEVANGRDLRGCPYTLWGELDFSNTDFSFAGGLGRFYHCDLTGAIFDGAQFISPSFGDRLSGASFRRAKLRGSYFVGAQANGCCFDGADLYQANFKNANCAGSSFRKAKCHGVCFVRANLLGCDFREANLEKSVLVGTTFDATTDFRGASLINAFYEDHFDNAGNLVNPGVDPRQGTWDHTTKFGEDPFKAEADALAATRAVALEEFGALGRKVVEILDDQIPRLGAKEIEHWISIVSARLSDTERETFEEDLLDQAYRRLRS